MNLNGSHIFIFFAFQVLTLVISAKEGPELLYTPQYDIYLFDKLYDALTSRDYDKNLAGIVEIQKLLGSPDPSYDGFERSGILRRLVEHLSSKKILYNMNLLQQLQHYAVKDIHILSLNQMEFHIYLIPFYHLIKQFNNKEY
jgi:hypothetical protein